MLSRPCWHTKLLHSNRVSFDNGGKPLKKKKDTFPLKCSVGVCDTAETLPWEQELGVHEDGIIAGFYKAGSQSHTCL